MASIDVLIQQAEEGSEILGRAALENSTTIQELQQILASQSKELASSAEEAGRTFGSIQQQLQAMEADLGRDLQQVHASIQSMQQQSANLASQAEQDALKLEKPAADMSQTAQQAVEKMQQKTREFQSHLQALKDRSKQMETAISSKIEGCVSLTSQLKQFSESVRADIDKRRTQLVGGYDDTSKQVQQVFTRLKSEMDNGMAEAEKHCGEVESHLVETAKTALGGAANALAVDSAKCLTEVGKSLTGGLEGLQTDCLGQVDKVSDQLDSTVGKVGEFLDKIEPIVKALETAKEWNLL